MMIRFNTIAQCALIVGFSFLIPSHWSFALENMKKGPCLEDAKKFCPNIEWGKGLGKCLTQHKTEISEGCAKKMTEGKMAAAKFQVACSSDIREFCNSTQPGRGRVMKCLRTNEAHLSPECRTEIQGLGLHHGDAINQNFGTT